MDNQHQQIKGYRDLSQGDIDRMNRIKALAEEVGALVNGLARANATSEATPSGFLVDQRWVSIGRTHLQEGFMALVRSVAQPTSF